MKTNDDKLATKWACDARTIRRWRLCGAPFDNHKAMCNWLASRKHLPPGTTALLTKKKAADAARAFVENDKPQAEGVAAALKRLEGQESKSFQELRRAQASGDPLAIKLAHATWMKNGEALRRYDLAIEQSRRDSGQLVPRDEMLRLIHELAQAFYFSMFAIEGLTPQLVGLSDPVAVGAILKQAGTLCLESSIAWLRRPLRTPVPPWMLTELSLVVTGGWPPDKVDADSLKLLAALRAVIAEQEKGGAA